MPVRLNIHVEGLAELQRKLRKDVLLAPPLRSAMNATIEDAARIVESRAPRASGRMAASITTRLDKRPVPTWGRVSVTARSRSKQYRRGFRYPRMLEYGPKSRHQRWFRNAVIPAKHVLARHLESAKRAIERIWSR